MIHKWPKSKDSVSTKSEGGNIYIWIQNRC